MPSILGQGAEQTDALKRHEIPAYIGRLDWPLYLFWGNGIFFFGFFGGFAFFTGLQQDPMPDELWIFAGSLIAGLIALIWLIFHITEFSANRRSTLVVDETSVTVSYKNHRFNFGMMEFILWDQDYRQVQASERHKKIKTKLLIAYRLGNHFEEGRVESFAFDAWTTPDEMADLQATYWRIMVIVKSRRKLQRENIATAEDHQKAQNIEGLVGLVN